MNYKIKDISIADKTMKALLYHKSTVKQRSQRLAVDFEQHCKSHRVSD